MVENYIQEYTNLLIILNILILLGIRLYSRKVSEKEKSFIKILSFFLGTILLMLLTIINVVFYIPALLSIPISMMVYLKEKNKLK